MDGGQLSYSRAPCSLRRYRAHEMIRYRQQMLCDGRRSNRYSITLLSSTSSDRSRKKQTNAHEHALSALRQISSGARVYRAPSDAWRIASAHRDNWNSIIWRSARHRVIYRRSHSGCCWWGKCNRTQWKECCGQRTISETACVLSAGAA